MSHDLRINEVTITIVPSEVASCKDLKISAVLTDSTGQTFTRTHVETVYEGILDDQEQLPIVIARLLRSMMTRRGWNRRETK